MPTGGDIIEITYNHPTLGSGALYPKAAEDNTLMLGGFGSNDDDNGIDGSGEAIYQMNRKRWKAGITVAWSMNGLNELEILRELSSSIEEAVFTMTVVNGTVWKGKGKPVGDLEGNVNAATIALTLAGGGLFQLQA